MSKVLIVEDDKYLNKLLSDRFKVEGFDVVSALDGASAWLSLIEAQESSHPIDIVISDILLPRLTGDELFRRIRKDKELKKIKLIGISGIYKEPDQIDSFTSELELESYWTKPFDFTELVTSITGKAAENFDQSEKMGSLAEVSIERIFLRAYLKGFSGLIIFTNQDKERKAYFTNGFPVSIVSNSLDDSLGFSLVKLGYIDEQTRESASQQMLEERIQFGQMLLKKKAITRDDLFKGIRKHNFRLILDTFTWNEGLFELVEKKDMPAHVLQIEYNPIILMMKAHQAIYSKDFIFSYFDSRKDQYCRKLKDFFRILPLFNMDRASRNFLKDLPGTETLDSFLSKLSEEMREVFFRVFYLMENLTLITWSEEPVYDNPLPPEDSEVESRLFSPSPEFSEDKAKDIQAEYIDLVNKNYYDMLDITEEATQAQVERAYVKLKDRLNPEQYGSNLPGEVKRILDDMLTRIDQAYLTLRDSSQAKAYLKKLKKQRKETMSDSKRFLKSQELFNKGLQYLQNQNFSQAKQMFVDALAKWKKAPEYDLYTVYADLRLYLLEKDRVKAEFCLAQLREKASQNPNSDLAQLVLGHAYTAFGQRNLARQAYKDALRINPRSMDASDSIAQLDRNANVGEVVVGSVTQSKVYKTIRKAEPWAVKTVLYSALIGALAFGASIYVERLGQEKDIGVHDVNDFKAHFPELLEARSKHSMIKMKLRSGWIETIPRTVLNSKCIKALKQTKGNGLSEIYLYDEKDGLKAHCKGKTLYRF